MRRQKTDWDSLVLGFVLFCLFAGSAHCQARPFVDGQAVVLNRLGYSGAAEAFAVGLDLEAMGLRSRSSFSAGHSPKLETGDGHSLRADQGLCYGRVLCLGIGDVWSRETTSQWTKAGHRPYALVAVHKETWELRTEYELPFLDKQNGLQGPNMELGMNAGRWQVLLTAGIFRFHDTRVPGVDYGGAPFGHHWGATTGLGIRRFF